MSNKEMVKRGLWIGAAVILLLLLGGALYTVEYNNYQIVKQFGRVVKVKDEPGLYLKAPFIQNTQPIYKGNRIYDIPASDVITKDKKSMIADDYVIWVVKEPVLYYQTLGAVSARAEERIDAAVYNATKKYHFLYDAG